MDRQPRDDHTTILKLGGSLLELPEMATRLVHLLDTNAIRQPLVVVGGGQAADLVRQWDQRFDLGDKIAHQLAIHAMSLNARLVATLHTRFQFCQQPAPASDDDSGHSDVHILDTEVVLQNLEATCPPSEQLLRSWDVTSDSIAAWLCRRLNVARLILLKSTDVPSLESVAASGPSDSRTWQLQRLSQANAVDQQFATQAARLPRLSWCNLRSPNPNLVTIW